MWEEEFASPKINLFRISREEEGLKMDAALRGVQMVSLGEVCVSHMAL
jgi:hypothetical protein